MLRKASSIEGRARALFMRTLRSAECGRGQLQEGKAAAGETDSSLKV